MVRTAVILGLICVTGPFAIDMYLPALPAIEESLGASVTGAQATLIAYFLAYGITQLVYGPLADQIGRKRTLIIGMSIFVVGSLICSLSGSIEMLVLGRAVQGLGGAAVMVVPRAIVRDMYTGVMATKLMATIMLVISVSPMLAPLAGSAVSAFGSWRLIFLALALLAATSLTMAMVNLPETLKPENRRDVNARELARSARILFRDPVFVGLTLIAGLGMSSFFLFIANASFVYTGQYGLSPVQFSLAFAFNAIGFFFATQMAGRLAARWSLPTLILRGVTGFTAGALSVALLVGSGFGALPVLLIGLFTTYMFLGVVIPSSMVVALDAHGARAGIASSLSGCMTMMTASASIAIASPFFDGTALPMVIGIAICSVGALVLATVTIPKLRRQNGEAILAE
ncbi:multidrug effflux MFS transporter [Sulfitobacter sp. LCG007]